MKNVKNRVAALFRLEQSMENRDLPAIVEELLTWLAMPDQQSLSRAMATVLHGAPLSTSDLDIDCSLPRGMNTAVRIWLAPHARWTERIFDYRQRSLKGALVPHPGEAAGHQSS